MNNDDATIDARANPQAYACMGLTFFGGLGGIFFAIFPTDVLTRVIAGSAGALVFSMGVIGHAHFKRKQREAGFHPSIRTRWTIGFLFSLLAVCALALAIVEAAAGDFGLCVLPIAFLVGSFRFVRAMFKSDENQG